MDNVLLQDEGLNIGGIDGSTCGLSDAYSAYNTGLYIGAYADIGNSTANQTAIDKAIAAAQASMTTQKWNNAQGIITQEDENIDTHEWNEFLPQVLIRYLYRSSHFFSSNPSVQSAILQYINTQYYGITHYDAASPKIFGQNWAGSTNDAQASQSQEAVLDILNAIHLNPDSAFPSSAPSGTVPVISV